MARSTPVTVGQMTFKSKKDAESFYRAIRDKYADYVPIQGADFDRLLELISLHPEAYDKIGVGIYSFTVGRDKLYGTTRCFYLHRFDGSDTDFSFHQCIKGNDPDTDRRNALRAAVQDQIFLFRDNILASGVIRCQYTGEVLNAMNSHVDHTKPRTLAFLICDWLTQNNLVLSDIQITPTMDNQFVASMTDELQKRSWCEYHRNNADLRLLSIKGNLSHARVRD